MQRLPENAGVNKLKRKSRDLRRLLNKPGLSAAKKQETERALKVIAEDLEHAMQRNQTKKIAQKYHMVRFFEKKKAWRALKKESYSQTNLADYYYVSLHPKDKKYVALFVPNAVGRQTEFYKDILEKLKSGELKDGEDGRREALQTAFKGKELRVKKVEPSNSEEKSDIHPKYNSKSASEPDSGVESSESESSESEKDTQSDPEPSDSERQSDSESQSD